MNYSEEEFPCDICHNFVDECICNPCTCGIIGDLNCCNGSIAVYTPDTQISNTLVFIRLPNENKARTVNALDFKGITRQAIPLSDGKWHRYTISPSDAQYLIMSNETRD